jgi:penicillin amidase
VFSNRLLRAVNLSIAILLVIFLGAVYWYAIRPLPETSGQIAAPVAAPAEIVRDSLGVPHIRAGSWEDAIFLQGYAMAQDRLWQMDALRRRAAGELAEVVGPSALALDQEARSLRMRPIAEMHERELSQGERAVFAAFARGVNHFIETHRGRLPLEFTLLGYDPRPWAIRDSILAGMEMYRTLTSSWRADLAKQRMLERGDRTKVEALFPVRLGGEAQPGSNAWAIAGSRTVSGKPILANDPHLEFSIPSPWYLVHLTAPGLDVEGATIVGLPAVIIGHNQRIAWGLTNLEFDVQDLYREELDPQTGKYRVQGGTEQAQVERDAIVVRNGRTIPVATFVTRDGPIFLSDAGTQYALRWSAAEAGALTFPFLDIDRAGNWAEFEAAVARYGGPGQNFVYADVEGNIGYQAGGRIPLRRNCVGDVPADGVSESCRWDGFVPFEQMPRAYNPAAGEIVSANQNPFPKQFPYPVNGRFAPPYRARQIAARLDSRPKWKPEEMIAIQTDVYSEFDDFLARQIVAAWDRKAAGGGQAGSSNGPKAEGGAIAGAVETLRGWNGLMDKSQAAPVITQLVFDELRRRIADRAGAGLHQLYQSRMAPEVIERLLRERPKDWFEDYDGLLIQALSAAVQDGARVQGSRPSRWEYGRLDALTILNPVEGRLPLIGKYFNIGPAAMSGAPTTVMQYSRPLGPSLRMVVDLAEMNHSFWSLATGESGQVLSRHYRDQWDAYYNGRTFPMEFGKVSGDVLRVRPGE